MGEPLQLTSSPHKAHAVLRAPCAVTCNSVENDPDIQHLPIFAVSKNIFDAPYLSSYHGKVRSHSLPNSTCLHRVTGSS